MKTFIKQFKDKITNKNLNIVGTAVIRATSATKVCMWINSSVEQTVRIEDPNGNTISTMVAPADNSRIEFGVADMSGYAYVNYVIPKAYGITAMYGHTNPSFGGAPDSMYYAKLENFNYSNAESFNDLFTIIDLSESNFMDDVFMNIQSINIRSNVVASGHHHINNVGFMGGCVNLTTIDRYAGETDVIRGSFSDVLSDMCKNGKTSGSLQVNWRGINSYCEFCGTVIQACNFSVVFNENGCVVTGNSEFEALTGYSNASYNIQADIWKVS